MTKVGEPYVEGSFSVSKAGPFSAISETWRNKPSFSSNPSCSANISSRTNEMGLLGPENPQLPRGFGDRDRTLETAGTAKIGL